MSNNNFWGNAATDATGEFDSGGGSFELIPEGTNVLAAISEIEWTLYNGDEYISAKWTVLKPDEFKNRKIFQKIRVMDEDVKKSRQSKTHVGRDRQKRQWWQTAIVRPTADRLRHGKGAGE